MYDIFSGKRDHDCRWVETAQSLARAHERMKEIVETKPGPYFVYSCHSDEVVVQVDTTQN